MRYEHAGGTYVRHAVRVLVLLFFLVAAAPLSSVQAQPAAPAFDVDAVSARPQRAASGRTRLDVYTRVPHASLRFLNTAGQFEARYRMAVEAYRLDAEGERQGRAGRFSFERTVRAPTFVAAGAADQFDPAARSMQLAPGRYVLDVRLGDLATDAPLRRTLEVNVRDLSGPVAVSDPIVLDGFDAASNTITPRVSRRLGTDEEQLQLFYELYADRARPVRVQQEIVRTRKSSSLPVLGALLGRREEAPGGEVTYTQARARTLKPGRTPVALTLPLRDAPAGQYAVRIRVEDADGNRLSEAETRVTVQWTGLTAHVQVLDEAVEQLDYIAKGNDIDYIRAGRTEAERLKRFEAFWDKRDPTPGTERNERMEEYYYRVARANRSYDPRGARDGWRSDRGHVLVLFGEPDAIERQPRSADAEPYEIWNYEQIGRRFIFVDQGGRFKLLEPIWDKQNGLR